MENLDCFFQDDLITKTVVYGSVTTVGILDQPDEEIGGGIVQSTRYELLVKTNDFPLPPAAGASITVGGTAYTIHGFSKIDDGELARIGLSKA